MPRRDQVKPLTEPTLVRRSEVPYVIWGDAESGFVNDLFYVLSNQLVFVTVTLPPGGRFRSSDRFRPFFDTHECLYVLEGRYTCQDPETGEVRTAETGEMLFMPEKRWHYGYNFGEHDLHLLECIAPPTNAAALAHVPRPSALVGFDASALKDWPRQSEGAVRKLRVCRRDEALGAVLGDGNPVLAEVFASTERVFFAMVTVPPNSRSDLIAFPSDVCYHGYTNSLQIEVPGSGEYFGVGSRDVVYLPRGTTHRLFNHTSATSWVLLGGAGGFPGVHVA
jgi:oxalate decarboxylase/phosphoglucose isomerase-like protein (cupin superfamily)